MAWFRWQENILQIFREDKTIDIAFPEIQKPSEAFHPPVFSMSGRYVAVADAKKIYVYDFKNNKYPESPGTFRNVNSTLRFDALDRIYYCDCNHIRCWDIAAQKVELLYTMSKAVHGPHSLGISPDCRYVSFCKYRSSNDYLYIYDTKSKQCMDMKRSLYHYIWIDETHIALTKCGGLNVLDVENGKNKTLIKDWTALYKKSGKDAASQLEMFCGKAKEHTYTDISVIGFKDERIFFFLSVSYYYREDEDNLHEELKSIHHKGVWSVARDGTNPVFHYATPDQFMKAIYKGFMEDGSIYWLDGENLNIFNGKERKRIASPCRPVRYYGMQNC